MNETAIQTVLTLVERTVWIITSSHGDDIGGLAATFVTNASLVPALPRLAIGIARHHHTWHLIERSGAFAAHLVDENQADLVLRFGIPSGWDTNKLTGVESVRGCTGSPLLKDALAWLECRVETGLDIGDRTIFVGAIVDGKLGRMGEPMTARRLFELADSAQRRRLDEHRRRDEAIDTTAILRFRALPSESR